MPGPVVLERVQTLSSLNIQAGPFDARKPKRSNLIQLQYAPRSRKKKRKMCTSIVSYLVKGRNHSAKNLPCSAMLNTNRCGPFKQKSAPPVISSRFRTSVTPGDPLFQSKSSCSMYASNSYLQTIARCHGDGSPCNRNVYSRSSVSYTCTNGSGYERDNYSRSSASHANIQFPSVHDNNSSKKNMRSCSDVYANVPRFCCTPSLLACEVPNSSHEAETTKKTKTTPLLTAVKPENEKSERERFFRANFHYNPYFIYRHPVEPCVLSRFAMPSDSYLDQAILIMERAIIKYGCYEAFEEQSGGRVLSRSQIMAAVCLYLRREGLTDEIIINLCEDMLSRGSMTKGINGKAMLNVRIVNLREYWLQGLLRHELGTHYLRSRNNQQQVWYSWKQRREFNMAAMNPTEEGFASLHSVLLRDDPCLWRSALLYYTSYKAAQLSFKELFKDLERFVKNKVVRWDYCMRAKRGQTDTSEAGAFCKDQVYLVGALQLLKHRKFIDFDLLIRLGKIAYQDIKRMEPYAELTNTRIPEFMKDITEYRRQLDRIALENGLTESVLSTV